MVKREGIAYVETLEMNGKRAGHLQGKDRSPAYLEWEKEEQSEQRRWA